MQAPPLPTRPEADAGCGLGEVNGRGQARVFGEHPSRPDWPDGGKDAPGRFGQGSTDNGPGPRFVT